MPITTESMAAWCRKLLNADPDAPHLKLEEYLDGIPRLDCLAKLPAGTPVLVRGDVDAKPGAAVGEGDVRLRSMKETIDFGRQHGWKQIVFGHVGREPEKSLAKVAARLGEILGCQVPLVEDWLDPATLTVTAAAAKAVAQCPPSGVVMLQNTRKYDVERILWKAKPADIGKLAGKLAQLANELAEKIARVYVHEAFSAGSLDASSVIVPAAMEKVALGRYEAEQFDGHLRECLRAEMVVFSGLKIDKLDDLQAMVARGKIRKVLAAGSLAMALKKAAAELDGRQFDLGLSEDPAHQDKPYFIPRDRIAQARKMIAEGARKGHRLRPACGFRAARRESFGERRTGQPAVRRWARFPDALSADGR